MSSHENEKLSMSQLARKIPREARPESCATEALQQFLRDISPPAEALSSDIKRLSSASSRHSRSKAFFKGLLRSNQSQHLLPNTYSHTSNGSSFPHNCTVLRQAVPGQHQQYYRIVRDSSHFDSLETKSTFRVNYQFQRHDVNGNRNHKDTMDKKNVEKSSKQTDSSRLNSVSTRFKPRFRIRVRKVVSSSSKQASLSHNKSSYSHTGEECRGRSSRRSESAVDEELLDSLCHQSIQPRITTDSINLQAQEIVLGNSCVGDIPRLGEIAAGSAFPASEIIKGWSRRRSMNSVKSSPGKIQGRNIHRPKVSINAKNIRNARSALPIAMLQSPASRSFIDSRPSSTLHSPTKHSKQLASPVKLGGQKHQHQDLLDRAKPLTKDLVPLALTSNPSRSFQSTLPDSPTRMAAAAGRNGPVIAENDTTRDRIAAQRDSAGDVLIEHESILNNVGTSTPIKKIASMSVDLGLPTTPPPRTPLPPVPRNSQTELSRSDSYIHILGNYGRTPDVLRLSDPNVPSKSPARMTRIMDLEKVPQSLKPNQSALNGVEKCDLDYQDNILTSRNLNDQRTPDFSSVEWPQPPKTGTNPDEPQRVLDPLVASQRQKDEYFRNRAERTKSLKRRHLQNANEQIRSAKGSVKGDREGSNISKVPLTTVMELPALQNYHLKSASSCSPNKSARSGTLSNHASLKKIPKLTFSSIKIAAVIKPSTICDTKVHHRTPRRTVYRSHSTQMTPRKHENRFDSESSASNDESTIIHDQQQDLLAGSNLQETLLDNLSLAATDDEKPDDIQNGHLGNLNEIILDRIDQMMSLMEDRLYKKLSQEIATRFVPLEQK